MASGIALRLEPPVTGSTEVAEEAYQLVSDWIREQMLSHSLLYER
jgi:hypothetical protein